MIKMRKRKFNGTLLVLAKLGEEDGISMLRLQELTGIRNWSTLNNAVKTLKELGFVEEEITEGPPVKRIIKLTSKGYKAAKLAQELLKLAGLL